MVNTPTGVSWPGLPLLTVASATSPPLRYTYARCSVRLTTTTIGPMLLSSPPQIHWPGFNAADGVPAGLDSLAPQKGTAAQTGTATAMARPTPMAQRIHVICMVRPPLVRRRTRGTGRCSGAAYDDAPGTDAGKGFGDGGP